MKKLISLFIFILINKLLIAQSFTANFTTVTGDIPGSSLTLSCFPVTVTGVGTIDGITKGLSQVCINITHTKLTDIEVLLEAPDGTYVPLSILNGGTGKNYTNTCFTATATTAIKFGTAPFTGTYLPEGHLGAVNNGQNANGTWNLCIRDRRLNAAGSKGNLNSFTVTFNNTPAPPAPPEPTVASCTNTVPSSNTCATAKSVCDFNGICGSTIKSTTNANTWTELVNGTCFGIDNNIFIKFIASASTASFNVWIPVSTGATDGGLQMIFFEGTCGSGTIIDHGCYWHVYPYPASGKPLGNVITASGLTPGNTYYLMLDGLNGAGASFTITANSGVNILNITPADTTICSGQSTNLSVTGGNNIYSWSPATGLNTTSGSTVTATPASTTTYTVSSSTLTGCPLTKDVKVTVNIAPVITSQPDPNGQSLCQDFPTLPLSVSATIPSGTINYQWYTNSTFSTTGGTLISGATLATYTPPSNVSGTFYYYCIVSNAAGTCSDTSDLSGAIIINPAIATPTASVTQQPDCITPIGTITVTGPVDVNIQYSIGGLYQTSGVFTGLTPGTTYSVIARDMITGCMSPALDLTINNATGATPAPSVSNPVKYCQNVTATALTATGTNLLWYTTATGGIGSATAITPGTASAGSTTYYVSQTISGCESPRAAITVVVSAAPVSPTVTTPVAYCQNNTAPALTATGTNLLWYTAATGGAALATAPTPSTTSVGSTTYYVSQTVGGCESPRASIAVTISTSITPVTGFSYVASAVCVNGSNPTINKDPGFTGGGTFSAIPAGLSINPTTGDITVATSAANNYTITYSVAASGCTTAGSNTAAFTISPTTVPVTGFKYQDNNSICNCDPDSAFVIPDNNFTKGGVYSISPAGIDINPATGAIYPPNSVAGTYTITYSVSATACSPAANSSLSVKISSCTVSTFTYSPAIVCQSSSDPVLVKNTGFQDGGIFSATPAGLSIDPTTGEIDISASNTGTYTITYDVSGVNICPLGAGFKTTAIFTIAAASPPVTGFNYTPNSVCANGTNPTLNPVSGFTTGGKYSASPAGLSIDAATGAINVSASAAGAYTIQYNITASGCTLMGSGTTSFNINPNTNPVTDFSYSPNTICANGSNPVLNTNAGFTTGGTFTATPAGLNIDGTTGAINVAASAAGNYTITYTTLISGCILAGSSISTVIITANTNPATDFSYTPNSICSNGNNPTLNTGIIFSPGGSFTAAPAGLSINSVTGDINVSASTAGNYTITYSVNASGCVLPGSSTTSLNIKAATLAPPVTTANVTYCQNANPSPFTAVGTNLLWYTTATGGTGSVNEPTIVTSTAGSTVYYVSQTVSGCEGPRTAITVNISAAPANPTITTPVIYCQNETASALTATGTSILWYTAATGGVGSATAPIPSTAANGTTIYYVSQTVGGCESPRAAITVTVNAIPASPVVTTPVIYCQNVTATALTATGTNLLWYTAATGGVGSATAPAPSTTSTGSTTYYVSQTGSGCESPRAAITVTVNAIPAAPAVITPVVYCQNVTAAALTATGTNLLWYTTATGGTGSVTAPTPPTTSTGSKNYYVSQTATSCESPRAVITVTINANVPPGVSNAGNCGPGTVTLSATGSGIINWYSDPQLSNLVNTGNSFSPVLSSTTIYYVTNTTGLCTSSSTLVTASINTIPAAPALGNDTAICEGDKITLDAGAYANYLWQDGTSDRTYVVSKPGIYSVQVGNSSGCTNSASINVGTETDCSDIYFPSAFAPDGKNNLFGPVSISGSISGITRYALTIYNRYGQIVFISENPAIKWDGTFKGKKLGNNSFVWYANYLYRGRVFKKQKGMVTLIR